MASCDKWEAIVLNLFAISILLFRCSENKCMRDAYQPGRLIILLLFVGLLAFGSSFLVKEGARRRLFSYLLIGIAAICMYLDYLSHEAHIREMLNRP